VREAKLQAAREAEFRLLETSPEPFVGRVWGCARWAKGCDSRIVEIPPYDDGPPSRRCGTHGLPMSTKIVERRSVGNEVEQLCDATDAERTAALTASDALRYLYAAWHNKFSTEELRRIEALRTRLETLAGMHSEGLARAREAGKP
jgi:hypothetical protein